MAGLEVVFPLASGWYTTSPSSLSSLRSMLSSTLPIQILSPVCTSICSSSVSRRSKEKNVECTNILRKTNNKEEKTKNTKRRLFLCTGVTSKGSVLCGSGFKIFQSSRFGQRYIITYDHIILFEQYNNLRKKAYKYLLNFISSLFCTHFGYTPLSFYQIILNSS